MNAAFEGVMQNHQETGMTSEQKIGCIGQLVGWTIVLLVGWQVASCAFEPHERPTIAPGAAITTMERWAAQIAQRDAVQDCGRIEVVTPAADGGFIIDCANGDRYRIAPNASTARFSNR